MRDLPRPGFEPVSPALAGEFLTPEPPGKPCLLLLDEMFCIYLLSLSDLTYYLKMMFLDDLSIDVIGLLNFFTVTIVLLYISPFRSVSICFKCLGAPMLGA